MSKGISETKRNKDKRIVKSMRIILCEFVLTTTFWFLFIYFFVYSLNVRYTIFNANVCFNFFQRITDSKRRCRYRYRFKNDIQFRKWFSVHVSRTCSSIFFNFPVDFIFYIGNVHFNVLRILRLLSICR